MAAFIVVPKKQQGGRSCSYEVIDTVGDPMRMRCGQFDDEHQAEAMAGVLNGAERVYRLGLEALDAPPPIDPKEPF